MTVKRKRTGRPSVVVRVGWWSATLTPVTLALPSVEAACGWRWSIETGWQSRLRVPIALLDDVLAHMQHDGVPYRLARRRSKPIDTWEAA